MTSFVTHYRENGSDQFGMVQLYNPIDNEFLYLDLQNECPDLPQLIRPDEQLFTNFNLIGVSGSLLIFRFISDSDLIFLDLSDDNGSFRLSGERHNINTAPPNLNVYSVVVRSEGRFRTRTRVDHMNIVNRQLVYHTVFPDSARRWLHRDDAIPVDNLDFLTQDLFMTFGYYVNAYFVGYTPDHRVVYFSAPWEELFPDSYDEVDIIVDFLVLAMMDGGFYHHRNDENFGPNWNRYDYDVEITTLTELSWLVTLERNPALSFIERILVFRLDPVSRTYRFVTRVPRRFYRFHQHLRQYSLRHLQFYNGWLCINLVSATESVFSTTLVLYHTTLGEWDCFHYESAPSYQYLPPMFLTSFIGHATTD